MEKRAVLTKATLSRLFDGPMALAQANGPDLVSALTDLTLSGGAGSDTFDVVPQDKVIITIDGGTQPGGGADQLNFDAQRELVSLQPGQVLAEGKPPVFYSGIEIFNLINQAYQLFLSFISH